MNFHHPRASQYLVIVGDRPLEVFTKARAAEAYAQQGLDACMTVKGYWTEPSGRGEYGPEAVWHPLSLDEPSFAGEFHAYTCKVQPDGGRGPSRYCIPRHGAIFIKVDV